MYNLKEETELLKTKRMRISKVIYENQNHEEVLNHTIVHSNKSVSIIVKDKTKLVFIKEFRSTTGKFYIEIPGGLIEDNETVLEAAKRETLEETGLILDNLKLLTKAPNFLDPSKSDEDFQFAIGEVVKIGKRHLDQMEIIDKNLIYLDLEDVKERLLNQINEGIPFYDNLYLTGHSAFALFIYFFS